MKPRIDYTTAAQVAQIIEQTGAKNFTIRAANTDGKPETKNAPVYSFTGNDNEKARREFIFWANLCGGNNFNVYTITLFDKNEEESETRKTKAGAIWYFNFTLNSPGQTQSGQPTTQAPARTAGAGSWEEQKQFIEMAIQSQFKALHENELNKRLEEIEKQLQDEEEEEEENGVNGQPSELMQVIGMISGMMAAKGRPAATGGLNGTPGSIDEKKARINNAIKRLYVIDKDLDKDLEKLADIAEGNPAQFDFLLSALRNM